MTQQSQAEFPQLDSSLVVLMFQQGEDPIECINKAMAFLSTLASRFPTLNNQLRTSSNPRNRETIQDGRVTVQQVQGRQNQREGHMARRCTQPKRPRNAAWFKEKLMFSEAQEANNPSIKAVLMVNLSSCDHEVLSEVPYSDSYSNDMINQDVQEMRYSKQTHVDDFKDNEIHSCSNIILYSQYPQESQDVVIKDTNPSAPNDLLVLSLVEQMTDHVDHLDKENQTNKMTCPNSPKPSEKLVAITPINKDKRVRFVKPVTSSRNIPKQTDSLKTKYSNKPLLISIGVKPTSASGSKPSGNTKNNRITLRQRNKRVPYDQRNNAPQHPRIVYLPILDINYFHQFLDILQDYNPMDDEPLWAAYRVVTPTPSSAITIPKTANEFAIKVEIEIPKELPKISLVKMSFQKLKNHLANFDKVVKVRTTPDAITKGPWGFEHTKKVFKEKVIPFMNSLRASFKDFENGLHNELNEVKSVFNQIEVAVKQCSIDKKYFDIQKKEVSLDNDRLLDHIICHNVINIVMHVDYVLANVLLADNKCLVNDNLEIERLEQENYHLFKLLLSHYIVHIYVNSLASRNDCHEMQQGFIDEHNKNLMLKAELAKKGQMVEKIIFDEVVIRCSRLKNRNVNLEPKLQHQKRVF
nr:hypothetical protein [Tanacetum cinerariifolium]